MSVVEEQQAEQAQSIVPETVAPVIAKSVPIMAKNLEAFANFVRSENGDPALANELLDIAKRMREESLDENGAFMEVLNATEKYPHRNDKRARVEEEAVEEKAE